VAVPKVWVFFYGSYMNADVLREVQLEPERLVPAKLSGFDIVIEPRANLVRSDDRVVYGVCAQATHEELDRLYAHARNVLGENYLPEPVLVELSDGSFRPALCYLCPQMTPRPAAEDYVDRILVPAERFGFPRWYLERIRSFKPRS
jgi:cation transport regulator ChaC